MKNSAAVILLLFFATAAFAADFGLVLGGDGGYAKGFYPEGFSVEGSLRPWVSAVLNETINFHVSVRMAFKYEEEGTPSASYFFEPERTELSLHPLSSLYLTLGRQ
jgi:hypothetical protein